MRRERRTAGEPARDCSARLPRAESKPLNELTARAHLGTVIARCPFALLIAEFLQRVQAWHSRKSKSSSVRTQADTPAHLCSGALLRGITAEPSAHRATCGSEGLWVSQSCPVPSAQRLPQQQGRGPVPKSGPLGTHVTIRELPRLSPQLSRGRHTSADHTRQQLG